jgi:hypothetical protein
MGNLLFNLLADRHFRAFRDLKKDRPGRINLLVGKNHVGETVTAQKQATDSQIKKILSKMLTICSLSFPS